MRNRFALPFSCGGRDNPPSGQFGLERGERRYVFTLTPQTGTTLQKGVSHSKEQRTEKLGAAWLPEQRKEDTVFKTIIHQFRSVLMLWFTVQAYRRPAAASPLRFAIARAAGNLMRMKGLKPAPMKRVSIPGYRLIA